MDFIGKIIAVLPAREGTAKSTGNPWKVQSYVIENHDQYPKKMCFDIFGEDKINQFAIQAGEELTVSFDIDAHEYQGRWFNSIRAWKVERTATEAPAPAPMPNPVPTESAQPPFDGGGTGDDLPF